MAVHVCPMVRTCERHLSFLLRFTFHMDYYSSYSSTYTCTYIQDG
jgi:hypothetical protein